MSKPTRKSAARAAPRTSPAQARDIFAEALAAAFDPTTGRMRDPVVKARAEAVKWKRLHDEAHITILRLSRMLALLEVDDFEKAHELPPPDLAANAAALTNRASVRRVPMRDPVTGAWLGVSEVPR